MFGGFALQNTLRLLKLFISDGGFITAELNKVYVVILCHRMSPIERGLWYHNNLQLDETDANL